MKDRIYGMINMIKFDRERVRYGTLLILIGLRLTFGSVQISMNVVGFIGIDHLNGANWSAEQKTEALSTFLIFPFLFGFLVSKEIVDRIDKKFPIEQPNSRNDE